MSEEFQSIFNELKRPALSDSEKARIRNDLSLLMSEHPASAPVHISIQDAFARLIHSTSSRGYIGLATVALSLLLVIGVTSSYPGSDPALPAIVPPVSESATLMNDPASESTVAPTLAPAQKKAAPAPAQKMAAPEDVGARMMLMSAPVQESASATSTATTTDSGIESTPASN